MELETLEQPALLSIADLSRVMKKNPAWVRAEIFAGRLKALRVGVEWRVRPSDLDAYLDARYSRVKDDRRDGRRRGRQVGPRPRARRAAAR